MQCACALKSLFDLIINYFALQNTVSAYSSSMDVFSNTLSSIDDNCLLFPKYLQSNNK